jgi:hypothetical protein
VWAALASRDPANAHRAVWQLAAAGDRAVRLLGEKLKPARHEPVDEPAFRRLLRDLDDDAFSVREAASAKLGKSDPAVLHILEKARDETSSAEVRSRLEKIIDRLKPVRSLLSSGELQGARAVQVLIYLNTPSSRQLLGAIAQGEPGRFSTRQARAALERMNRP